MTAPSRPTTPSLRDLLLLSDFGRANPRRVAELLDRVSDPLTEQRNERVQERRDV